MREVKFRAWSKSSERFHEWKDIQHLHIHTVFNMCSDTLVIEQYTGLKDCDGVEIYEGDIVRSEHFIDLDGEQHYVRHTCEWSNKYSGWYFRNNAESFDGDGGLQAFVMMKFLNARKIKIIGNIHQNPELIK